MNLYLIKADRNGWDEYDSILVIEENSKEAKNTAYGYFSSNQKLRCSFEGISNRKTKGVLIASFNAA